MDENNSQKKSKRFLVIYCVAIFVFAAVLILLSSMSQMRLAREADAMRGRLSDTETLAQGAQSKLNSVLEENEKLRSDMEKLTAENKTLTDKSETLTKENDELTKRLYSSQMLTKLVNLRREGSTAAFREAHESFIAAGCPSWLSEADLELYNSIK